MMFSQLTSTLSSFVPGLAPFHLLAYSTLLGAELYQSFVVTKVCFQALPRSAFTTLQKRIFPLYFQGQSLLLVLVAVTFPSHSVLSLAQKKGDWIPFVIAGVTAVLNLVIYGPRTQKVMVDRIHQETRDARKSSDEGEVSEEMRLLNRKFSRTHAMSIHLNLITVGATLWYGWRLASKLNIGSE
ncbi:hypothetical protein K505DRAFT_275084 [Melanomma pulvis-pyrius CBS 109.77]|uniref:TMEM205-like domain-containing protein n=1 Tax=Melanomma pulvis-pyrius CBS 109.77 TaxID=1314802 RepID=A0A6A6XDF9_9PLEO|nr:hypothetical protein K505DRAFT_275084 [Melanomma pulvis-pyrius CBS 109.77]